MDGGRFDAWTRRTATTFSRRRSLLKLSGAAMAGVVAAPSVAEAGQCGEKCRKRCRRQVGKCEDVVRAFCEGQGMGCLQALLPCCDPLGACNSAASTQCFIEELFTG